MPWGVTGTPGTELKAGPFLEELTSGREEGPHTRVEGDAVRYEVLV